jgi:hypothetical protein
MRCEALTWLILLPLCLVFQLLTVLGLLETHLLGWQCSRVEPYFWDFFKNCHRNERLNLLPWRSRLERATSSDLMIINKSNLGRFALKMLIWRDKFDEVFGSIFRLWPWVRQLGLQLVPHRLFTIRTCKFVVILVFNEKVGTFFIRARRNPKLFVVLNILKLIAN